MNFIFKDIEFFEVLEIQRWRYNGFEKQLYMDCYHESRDRGEKPLKGPRGCKGFSVYRESRLAGLFEFYFEERGVYLGLALAPELVGRGLSREFILSGIEFGKSSLGVEEKVYLSVHRRNIQGVKAYEKAGFKFVKKIGEEIEYCLDI